MNNNKIGKKLKELRGFQSLRTVSEKTGKKISHAKLLMMENGINPNNGLPTKPKPDDLKILSEVYDYPYEELLILAGYLTLKNENKVKKLVNEFMNLTNKEKEEFLNNIKQFQ